MHPPAGTHTRALPPTRTLARTAPFACPDNFCFVHVSLVPATTDGEQKTKPTQHTIRDLRGLGLTADVIACRSSRELDADIRRKISQFCDVAPGNVFSVYDCDSIYHVPLLLQKQGILDIFNRKMGLDCGSKVENDDGVPLQMVPWASMAERYIGLSKPVKIALVGKYTKQGIVMDAYSSVIKALRHSCLLAGYKLELELIPSEELEDETFALLLFRTCFSCGAPSFLFSGGVATRDGVERFTYTHFPCAGAAALLPFALLPQPYSLSQETFGSKEVPWCLVRAVQRFGDLGARWVRQPWN